MIQPTLYDAMPFTLLSAPRDPWQQAVLFDEPLGEEDHGRVRTVIGDLAERLTARQFNGIRYKTDSRAEYCPDVVAGSMYIECKAVGQSNQAFIYGGRLVKDRTFSLTHTLWYVIWNHAADTKLARTVLELEKLVLATMRGVYLVPFKAIDAVCSVLEPEPLNSRYGRSDNDEAYGSGYRFPLSSLTEWLV